MTRTGPGLVTVLVPAYNEAAEIEHCINAIAAQSVGAERIQLVVVDGDSDDGTAALAAEGAARHPFAEVLVLDNPARSTPSSLNLGLAEARGQVLCRVDARAFIPPDYVRRCVELLEDRRIAVVGGVQLAVATPGAGVVARGIARALRNPYATGLSRYRLRRSSGPADTTYLGAFRTEEVRSIGGWDLRFATNQDYELNSRLRGVGLVWFAHDLVVEYRPRSDLLSFARQHRRFGRWKAGGWTETGLTLAPRHVGLVVVPPLAGLVALSLLRRHPLAASLGVLMAAFGLDALSRDPADVDERCVAVVAMGVSAGSWWLGIVEQLARRARGERLLGDPQPS